jgi:DNA replication protein DnaC
MLTPSLSPPSERLTALLTSFGATTAAEEIVPRLTHASQQAAIRVLVEVFEADTRRLPVPIIQRLQELATGAFLETATNVLAFGLPGVGKRHALRAVAHALVKAGHRVLFAPAYAIVQELLSAKRNLDLPRALRKLDLFEVLLLDDLGCVQQSPEEAEVLFTLLAERYERRSVMVTSNLVFSQWERIFRDQMATAAAIDRLVHHAVILEFDVPSYRTDRSRPPAPSPSVKPRSPRARHPGPMLPKRHRDADRPDRRLLAPKLDRTGGARNHDRRAGKGQHPPASSLMRRREQRKTNHEERCGNDGPAETTERFPPDLANLAENARFAHSHSASALWTKKNAIRHTTVATRRSINRRRSVAASATSGPARIVVGNRQN